MSDTGSFKILICDDSTLARRQTKAMCNELGYNDLYEASNGQSSIDIYKEIKPDIVLLDIVMPEKDGITVLKELKEFDDKVYVIIISSVATKDNLKSAINEGALDFITKPINIENLKKIFETFIERRQHS